MDSVGVGQGPLKCPAKPARCLEAEFPIKAIHNYTVLQTHFVKLQTKKVFFFSQGEVHRSIKRLIDCSVHPSIDRIERSVDGLIDRSMHWWSYGSVYRSIEPLVDRSIYGSIDWSVDRHRSIRAWPLMTALRPLLLLCTKMFLKRDASHYSQLDLSEGGHLLLMIVSGLRPNDNKCK